MTSPSTLVPGKWARSGIAFRPAVRSALASLAVPNDLSSRRAVEDLWVRRIDVLSGWAAAWQDLVILAAPDAEIALATAAIIWHESRGKPVCFYGSRVDRGSPVRSQASELQRGQIGLGLGQVTDINQREWFRHPSATRLGESLKEMAGKNYAFQVHPAFAVAYVADNMTRLRRKYSTITAALTRYAGKQGISEEEYAARPTSLIAYMDLPEPQTVYKRYME